MKTLSEQAPLTFYNSLSRSKERFSPIAGPHVGLYVCGPTVYGDPHLGHARTAITFDTVFRYLTKLGYQVRYVRNITDVGHLEDEVAEDGEDKIAKRAKLERLEPMEIVQRYTQSYHDGVRRLNCLPPSIEPRASGHIIEQIEVVKRILDSGLAYEKNGSVYFDLERYARSDRSSYGKLSGKVFDDLIANTRQTFGSEDKASALDFALWKRAEPGHLMHWPSPWGDGFPGWHIECTTMSTKYLGETFDIHGGGMDLQFPHHEAEIAQSHGAFGTDPAHYWMHGNMLTVNGQKMAKSLGNFITLEQMFTGDHPQVSRSFDPMVLRFFVLQTHYRSLLDFSSQALEAAEAGLARFMAAYSEAATYLDDRPPVDIGFPDGDASGDDSEMAQTLRGQTRDVWLAMSDDFHTPRAIAGLFELGRSFRRAAKENGAEHDRDLAAASIVSMTEEVLGLRPTDENSANTEQLDGAMRVLIRLRQEARAARDFARADAIRDELLAVGIELADNPDGSSGYRIAGKTS